VAMKRKGIWFDKSFYPFQRGSLDLNSLLFLGVILSVIRGYSRESVSAFRLSAAMAFAYSITSYPGLVGAYRFTSVFFFLIPRRFYTFNNFQDDTQCKDFFLNGFSSFCFCSSNTLRENDWCVWLSIFESS
jgi:hypothetical protein